MLQLRMDLPAEFGNEQGLTQEGEDWMNVYRALMEKQGLSNFKIVRLRT